MSKSSDSGTRIESRRDSDSPSIYIWFFSHNVNPHTFMSVAKDQDSASKQIMEKLAQLKTKDPNDDHRTNYEEEGFSLIQGGIINCSGNYCTKPQYLPGGMSQSVRVNGSGHPGKYYDTLEEFLRDSEPKVLPLSELTCIFSSCLSG